MEKIGEVFTNKKGETAKIVEYLDCENCTIQFEDGCRKENVTYRRLNKGTFKKPLNRTGEEFLSNQGYSLKIIEYNSFKDCVVLINNHIIVKNLKYSNIKKGAVVYPYHRSVFGIGYLGEGDYNLNSGKAGVVWRSMVARGYDTLYQEKQPTYKDVTVCDEWHCFQNFAQWYENNWKPWMDNTWQLDKDILQKGNKIYSPKTCCFVPREINASLSISCNKDSTLPIGVIIHKGKYIARIGKERRYLGSFKTPEEAFQVYKIVKEQCVKKLAIEWKSKIAPDVYQAIYDWKVEII